MHEHHDHSTQFFDLAPIASLTKPGTFRNPLRGLHEINLFGSGRESNRRNTCPYLGLYHRASKPSSLKKEIYYIYTTKIKLKKCYFFEIERINKDGINIRKQSKAHISNTLQDQYDDARFNSIRQTDKCRQHPSSCHNFDHVGLLPKLLAHFLHAHRRAVT
jgi:hypothetical protein